MKKYIFLLLLCVSGMAQTYQNPTFGTVKTMTAPTSVTPPTMATIQADNVIGKIIPEDIPMNVIPPTTHYTPTTPTLKGHFQGLDNAIGNIPLTTAGNTTRIWFTGDATTIGAGTFYLTAQNKGTVANVSQSVINDDNQKKYFTQDLIGQPFATATIFPPGAYSGNLSASTTPNSARQRFTIELYKCNNAGTPIASGVSGAPVGSLGVTVVLILDSGEITLADGSVTNILVSGSLASQFSIGVGERIRYHVSAEKVGTTASNITESVWYGNSFNSFIDVPTPITSSGVSNVSTVTGASVTNALDNLNSGKENIANKATDFTTVNNTLYASVQATKTYVDGVNSFVSPNQFAGTDTQKIQLALNYAAANNKTLRIDKNNSTGLNIWDIENAILLKSNSKIVIDGVTLKLTNTSRDNIFRTENCGFGITNPSSNPLVNISITGVNGGGLQGADNPRSTGDTGKTLSLNPGESTDTSYGTDAGVGGQTQTGDWRNIGILMSYTTNVKIYGLKITNMHAWSVSFERCAKIDIQNIDFYSPTTRVISASTKYFKNLDGIDFRLGCSDIYVNNISGLTGDDTVAVTLVPVADKTSGIYGAMEVTGNSNLGSSDNAKDIIVSNVKVNTDHGIVRLLNVLSTTIKNVQITNIEDLSTSAPTTGSCVIMGSTNPVYGGITPIGDLAYININSVICRSKPHAIRIDGSISESSISNVIKESGTNEPIYFHPSSLGSRDLAINNIIYKGNYIQEAGMLTGTTPVFYGASKAFTSSNIVLSAFETSNLVSAETNMNNYILTGTYVTPSSGLTNIPSGWAQKRYNITTSGASGNPYKEQTITDNTLNIRAFRSSSVASVWSSWEVLAEVDSPNLTGDPKAPTPTAGDNDTSIANSAFVSNAIATAVSSGTYTPTITNGSNATGATLGYATYTKVGNIVTATVHVTLNVTAAGTTTNVLATLPVNRVSTTQYVTGTGYAVVGSITTAPGVTQLEANTTQVRLSFVSPATGTGPANLVGTFSYHIN